IRHRRRKDEHGSRSRGGQFAAIATWKHTSALLCSDFRATSNTCSPRALMESVPLDPDRSIAIAVRTGRVDEVRRLLDAGARPDQMNIYGDTLVDMARDRGH